MEELFFFLVLAFLILVALENKLKNQKKEDGGRITYPYSKINSLFTSAERSFLGVLDRAIGDQFRIFGKVRIADIAEVKGASGRREGTSAFNRISRKHFDFVLCDKENLSIVCGIELNDKSHQKQNRKDRDDFIECLCETISLPLVTIQAQRAYTVSEIRANILKAIGASSEVAQEMKKDHSFRENPGDMRLNL